MIFTATDWFILAFYFLIIFGISFYFSRKKRNSTDYFLAGRHVGWFAVGASLFASNISTEHFIGLSGSGFKSGLAVGNFEWSASICLMILAWIFVPFYLKSGVFTMPEFLEKRYSSASRWYLSAVSIIAYIVTKISVHLFAFGILLKELMNWEELHGSNLYISAIILVIITGIYTMAGGMSAVIYTELIQTFILLIGAICLTIFGIQEAGGIEGIKASVPSGHWEMFKPNDHPDFPWVGIAFTSLIIGIWYWCTDQSIVQRVLAAKNINHAKAGSIYAGYLKILPVFILVIPGLIAYALHAQGKLAPGAEMKPDEVYPMLVSYLLPPGIRSIVIAALLAALMGSLAACFNSASTLITFDVYKKYYPEATESKLIHVGRIATVILVLLSLLWVPFVGGVSDQLFVYLQSVQAYISPPIAVVFLAGVLWTRANSKGALFVLWSGFIIGGSRFVLEIIHKNYPFQNGYLKYMIEMNFLHFAIVLFVISIILLVLVSILSEKPAQEKLNGLTFKFAGNIDLTEEYKQERAQWKKHNIIATGLLIVILASLWIIFA
ncbi:MAG: sodium:solute symporter [Cytophagaceae bacterium]|nr:sodium:solute symporter [Cytophagaceae bacterium]